MQLPKCSSAVALAIILLRKSQQHSTHSLLTFHFHDKEISLMRIIYDTWITIR
uniref:Uncharacterized protein n=1 Tax=Anguilla anguilla TaxID=7936 RepID=A0A0E9WTT1_ANGAN